MGPKFKHKIHLFSYIPYAQSLKGSFVDCFSYHLCFDYGLADGVRCGIFHCGIVPLLRSVRLWSSGVGTCMYVILCMCMYMHIILHVIRMRIWKVRQVPVATGRQALD